MKALLTAIFIISLNAYSQEWKHRFQFGVGLHALVNYGKTMTGISTYPIDYISVYKQERYDIDYKNFRVSNGFTGKFSVNLVNNDEFFWRYSFSLFFEIYSDEVEYTLSDIGNGDTTGHANLTTKDIPLGYQSSAVFDGISLGVTNELLILKKLKNGYSFGGGLAHIARTKSDQPTYFGQYVPWGYPRLAPVYTTQQLAFCLQFEKKFEVLSWSVNIAQTFVTTKAKENKGANYFEDGQLHGAVSHNLDYRFPLVLQLGVVYNFDKIKR